MIRESDGASRRKRPLQIAGIVLVIIFVGAALWNWAAGAPPDPLVAPRISFVGDLQNRGILPAGFVPAANGVRVQKMQIGILSYIFPYYAVCLTSTRLEPAVIAVSESNLKRWLAGKSEQLQLSTEFCAEAWEACWPTMLSPCPLGAEE